MVFVLKNILKYERIVMIMVLYNKVVIYEINEWVYINFDMKKNYWMLYNEFMGLKIELLLNYEYSFVLNIMFFVGFFCYCCFIFYFLKI